VTKPFRSGTYTDVSVPPKVERWFAALCLFPVLVTASVYLEAIVATMTLHHWPIPSIDDPKSLTTWPLHAVSTILILAIYPLLVILLAIALKNWRVLRVRSRYWIWMGVYVVGYAVLILSSYVDPWRVWYWWWD